MTLSQKLKDLIIDLHGRQFTMTHIQIILQQRAPKHIKMSTILDVIKENRK